MQLVLTVRMFHLKFLPSQYNSVFSVSLSVCFAVGSYHRIQQYLKRMKSCTPFT
jgi:hypothetical protein